MQINWPSRFDAERTLDVSLLANLTKFQRDALAGITAKASHMCQDPSRFGRAAGPIAVVDIIWYDQDDDLHMTRLGVDSIVREIVSPSVRPHKEMVA